MVESVSASSAMFLDSSSSLLSLDSNISNGWSSSSSSSSSSDGEWEEVDRGGMSPRKLLALAIQRRRVVYNGRERDLRLELLHTSLIHQLCKYLGERRARRRHHRRAAKRHRCSSNNSKLEYRKREYSSSGSEFGSGSDSGFLEPTPPGVDHFSGFSDLANTPPAEAAGQFGYSNHLYSLSQQDNCVQLHYPSNAMEAELLPPAACKKPRCSSSSYGFQSDSDPFGLDALFSELYGPSNVPTGLFPSFDIFFLLFMTMR